MGRACSCTHINHYQKNKPCEHIFEFFLFVNPLGSQCLSCEEELLRFINESEKRVHLTIIAAANLSLFYKYLHQANLTKLPLLEKNRLYQGMQEVAIGYKAALLQGKKCGHAYLMTMQEHFGKLKEPFTKESVIKLVDTLPLDSEVFWQDVESGDAKRSLQRDHSLLNKMMIQNNPTLVIYDNLNFQYGVKVENFVSAKQLHTITDEMEQAQTEQLRK